MLCKIFNCDRAKQNLCCAHCRRRKSCDNPCLNDPSRCGQARKASNKEIISRYHIKRVTGAQREDILFKGQPLGLFYHRVYKTELYAGIRNLDGKPMEYQADSLEAVLDWLIGEEGDHGRKQ